MTHVDTVRIESDPHYTITRAGTVTNTKTGRALKPFPRGKANGLSVDLPSGTHYVHTLVAAAFLGPRPEGHDIIHLDGDQVNLHADNLAYVTRSERVRDQHNQRRRARRQIKGVNTMTNTPNPGIEGTSPRSSGEHPASIRSAPWAVCCTSRCTRGQTITAAGY
ncbi:HNH endonuclease signature motif containing protein [Pseudoglutamicibacter cumminsii]|uniref:HNH endonuclease signature motif containing protein n=1 Tax=Pseudoglutamicibacter cumminsii TaxID=156979 RepID=UPI0019574E81|nr:hypothetical protein [Pseudoglutamicibacter cumminsii]